MVKKWEKKLKTLNQDVRKSLEKIVEDIILLNLDIYQVSSIQWHTGLYRIRKWNIRIIFSKEEYKWVIKHISFRWGVYKKY